MSRKNSLAPLTDRLSPRQQALRRGRIWRRRSRLGARRRVQADQQARGDAFFGGFVRWWLSGEGV